MAPGEFRLEPEVEALIQEVARDPRSSFFKVERPKRVQGLLQSWDAFSATSAGWTSAERHLLRAHREEVAQWMRTKIFLEGKALNRLPIHVDHKLYVQDKSRPIAPDLLQALGRASLAAARADGDRECAQALDQALQCDAWTLPALYDLSVVALRLAPCDVAWLRTAWMLSENGHNRSAIHLVSQRMASTASPAMESFMWENLACYLHLDRQHQDARKAYDRACVLGETRINPLAGWLVQSLMTGDRDSASRAASTIDEVAGVEDDTITSFASSQRSAKSGGAWICTPSAGILAGSLLDSLGPPSRSIVDVYR